MTTFRAWVSRVWFQVTTLLEKPNVPGTVAISLPALGLVLLYLFVVSMT